MKITLTEFLRQLKQEYYLAVEYGQLDKARELYDEYHALTGKHL